MRVLPDPVFLKIRLRHLQVVDGPEPAVSHRRVPVQDVHAVDLDAVVVESLLDPLHLAGPPIFFRRLQSKTSHAPDVRLHGLGTLCPDPEPGLSFRRVHHFRAAVLILVFPGGPALLVKGMDQSLINGVEHQYMLREGLAVHLFCVQRRLLIREIRLPCSGACLSLRPAPED